MQRDLGRSPRENVNVNWAEVNVKSIYPNSNVDALALHACRGQQQRKQFGGRERLPRVPLGIVPERGGEESRDQRVLVCEGRGPYPPSWGSEPALDDLPKWESNNLLRESQGHQNKQLPP
eukprot:gene5207-biopygen4918